MNGKYTLNDWFRFDFISKFMFQTFISCLLALNAARIFTDILMLLLNTVLKVKLIEPINSLRFGK